MNQLSLFDLTPDPTPTGPDLQSYLPAELKAIGWTLQPDAHHPGIYTARNRRHHISTAPTNNRRTAAQDAWDMSLILEIFPSRLAPYLDPTPTGPDLDRLTRQIEAQGITIGIYH